MSARNYQLNSELAKSVNNHNHSIFINTSGKYKGVFTSAEYSVNRNGNECVTFSFEDSNGKEAHYLTLYTHNIQGKELPGLALLNAIMTCVKIKLINATNITINRWDNIQKKKVPTQIMGYPELIGKPIGLLFQEEEYESDEKSDEKSDGKIKTNLKIIKTSLKIYASFSAETEQVASEILNQESAQKLGELVTYLSENPVKKVKTLTKNTEVVNQNTGNGPDEFNDDIPF